MMGESGIINQDITEEAKPTEPVAGSVEESEAKPQATDELEDEVFVEIEADQQEQAKEAEPDYKVMARQKHEKMKKQREAKEKAERENRELKERLAKAEAAIAQVSAGKKPDPEDYYGDPAGYAEAVRNWESKQPKAPEQKPEQQVAQPLPDEVEQFTIESSEKMKTMMPAYESSEEKLKTMLQESGSNVSIALNQLADITYGEEIDYAQAIVGLAEVPGALQRVMSATTHGTLKRAIKDAASKVKVNTRKRVDTKPEPEINSSGSVNSLQAKEKAARDKWMESRSAEDYSALQTIRRQIKSGQN